MPVTRVRSVERIHTRLRSAIIGGDYRPGAILSQVELARNFGVSRTPLREALRRLEAEGLVESLQNRRTRVATIDAETLDVLFTERILLEAMGINVTVPFLTEIDLNNVLSATTALRIAVERGDARAQDRARRTLHARYVARAGERLRAAIGDGFDRCERYRRLYVALPPETVAHYVAIAGACAARDARDAARRVAHVEAALACAVLTHVNLTYEPVAVRTALRMLAGTDA